MARYPKAVWRPLPENTTQARITPRSFIVHSAAVDSANVHGYFARADVKLESHFFVLKNGTVEQFIDTEVRADANGQANPWALSAETEDDGDPDNQPWTGKQIDSLVDLLGWACDTHNIPRQQLPKWDGAGIGWHSQFGAPSPLTTVRGKTCPGRVRILQFREIVLPAVLRPPTTTPEDTMALTCIPTTAKRLPNSRFPFYRLDPTHGLVLAYNGAPLRKTDGAVFGVVPFMKLPPLNGKPIGICEAEDGSVVVVCEDGGTVDAV